MRYITFIRHAKSSWASLDISDHDRPLNNRGYSDAPMIGHAIHSLLIYPHRIYSSSARRAKETAQAIAKGLQHPLEDIVYDKRLYLFTTHTEAMLDIIRDYDDEDRSIFIVGHNETMETLAHEISGGSITSFPTCAVLNCQVDIDSWTELELEKIEKLRFFTPKMFKD